MRTPRDVSQAGGKSRDECLAGWELGVSESGTRVCESYMFRGQRYGRGTYRAPVQKNGAYAGSMGRPVTDGTRSDTLGVGHGRILASSGKGPYGAGAAARVRARCAFSYVAWH